MTTELFRTEFEFTLPRGYVDADGNVHRDGVMRLATARDEIEPLHDARANGSSAYLSIVLLSRVIERLGAVSPVSPAVVQELFASDFAYLQHLYVRLNEGHQHLDTQCPTCGTRFAIDLMSEAPMG